MFCCHNAVVTDQPKSRGYPTYSLFPQHATQERSRHACLLGRFAGAWLSHRPLIVLVRKVSMVGSKLREEQRDSDKLLLEVPLEESSEEVVTGAGKGLLVLGISEAGYWDCGGRLGNGGIINCRLFPDSGVGRCPCPCP